MLQSSLALQLHQLLTYACPKGSSPPPVEIMWKALLLSCNKECSLPSANDADATYDALSHYFNRFHGTCSDYDSVQIVRMVTRAVYLSIPLNIGHLVRWWNRAVADLLKVHRLADQKYKVLYSF